MSRPGHWPSIEGLWILRAALLEGDLAVKAWRRVAATADIETLDPGSARLLPLLQPRSQELGLENPWRDRVRGIYRYWWAHNQLLIRTCAQAVSALEEAGITTMILKGVPLALHYYGDPGLRPMSDVDVLVPRADVPRTMSVLGDVGWRPEKRVDESYMRALHGVSLHRAADRTIDLHWAIHEDDVRPDADEAVWQTALPFEFGGTNSLMPAPATLLMHALAGGAKWAADPQVRWLADATVIIRRGDVDWDAFVDDVERRRFVVRVRSCLAYLRVALGVTVPSSVEKRLDALPVSRFQRIEHRVRTQPQPLLGELPRYWLAWVRSSPNAWQDLAGFGSYLRSTWDLPSWGSLPAAATRRVLWRLRTRRPPDPNFASGQSYPPETALSTSSQ